MTIKTLMFSAAFALGLSFVHGPALAGTDSTIGSGGSPPMSHNNRVTWDDVTDKPNTATRWPRYNEVTNKPSNYPTNWNSISGKPSSFSPSSHNHDDRYVRRSGNSSINGDLTVSGTVTGNRIVTGDVSGSRWCRANSSGRIRCTHEAPSSDPKDVVNGWPLILLCGSSSDLMHLTKYSGDSMRYVGVSEHQQNALVFERSNGDMSDHNGVSAACQTNIDDIPSNRKKF